jgi:hypothetical protein
LSIGERLVDRGVSVTRRDDVDGRFQVHFYSFVHHLLRGDWSDRHLASLPLCEQQAAKGQLWEATNFLSLAARRVVLQGRFLEAERILARLVALENRYQYDLARSSHQHGRALLLLEREDLGEALSAGRAYYAEHGDDAINLIALGLLAKAAASSGLLDDARGFIRRGRSIMERNRAIAPYQRGPFLRSQLLTDLICLEASSPENRRSQVRSCEASARSALRCALRSACERSEVLRLVGRYHWLQARPRRAANFWVRSMKQASSLDARMELARTHLEIAERLPNGLCGKWVGGSSPEAHRAIGTRILAAGGRRDRVRG